MTEHVTALDAEDLDTIEIIARNEQSGRITRYEINELVRVYRRSLSEPAAPAGAEVNGEYVQALAEVCEILGVPFSVSGSENPAGDVVKWIAANVSPAQPVEPPDDTLKQCLRKKSDMTPCVITDGPICYAENARGYPICVGCERGPKVTGVLPHEGWKEPEA